MTTGNYATMGTGMDAYHQQSAEQCFLHNTCDCCTCRCCGLCILILWVIFGLFNGISSLSMMNNLDYHEICPDNSGDITGQCCGFTMSGTEYVIGGTCDNLKTYYEIGAANNIR